jgi:VanZ family protein
MIVCAIPGGSLPKVSGFNIPYFDKIVHAFLYIPLTFFLGAEFDLSNKTYLRIGGPFITMLIIAAYGGLIEILQGSLFINRSADIADLLADVVGGLAGLAIYHLFFKSFFRRFSTRQR